MKQKLFFLAGPGLLLLSIAPMLSRDQLPTDFLPIAVGEWLAGSHEQDEEVGSRRRSRDEFLGVLDDVVLEMYGGLSLCEATDRIMAYCSERYPFYLEILRFVEVGSSVRERVAINLARQYVCMTTPYPDLSFDAVVQSWQVDLAAIRDAETN